MSEHTHTHDHEHERCQEHEHHDHQHEHHHDHDHGPAHIHSHRNIIGFDENGIPTVILKASHGEGEEDDPHNRLSGMQKSSYRLLLSGLPDGNTSHGNGKCPR